MIVDRLNLAVNNSAGVIGKERREVTNRQVAVVGQSYRKDNASMFLKPGIVVRPSAKEGESVGRVGREFE